MTKEEILNKHYSLMPKWRPTAEDQEKAALDAMEEYAQHQVNSVDLADVRETLSKPEFQTVMKRELEGFREMNIFDLSDEAGELLASSIWDDHKVIER